MTKVGQLFEDEKNRAVEEAIAKVTEEITEKVTKEITEKVTKEITEKVTKEIAEKALRRGFSVEVITEILDMSNEKVLEIQNKLCITV